MSLNDSPATPTEVLEVLQQQTLDRSEAYGRRARVLPERLREAASVDVGQSTSEVVYRENKLALHHYESLTEDQHDIPILIVYALINKPYILDLQPSRSVVRRLLEAGHDVYLIDWGEPTPLDASLGLEDYVTRYIHNCVEIISDRSGRRAINVLGYCMGGTMATMYAALNPDRVNALGLMAAGLYFDDSGGVLELWGDEEYYDPASLVGSSGNVPGEYLDVGFAMMDPVSNYLTKYVQLFDRIENEDFVENFARMERWLSDSVDVPGRVYRQFIEDIYQRNRLYENELSLNGQPVDVTEIDMPMLLIMGKYDHLIPPGATTPIGDVVGTENVTAIEYPVGHVGLAMSRSSHRDVWPEVAEWFLEQAAHPALADVIGTAVERAMGVDVETDVTVGNVDEIELAVADGETVLARSHVRRNSDDIARFFETALDIDIDVSVDEDGVVVDVRTQDGVTTHLGTDIGRALLSEIQDAVQNVDHAARFELTDIRGIGPTYSERLRAGGIDSVSALARADVERVGAVADVGESVASRWIDRAGDALESPQPDDR